jgi:tRNA 5-methylaminomethyl-2-thiouridine biosynthesis bifunctional protein
MPLINPSPAALEWTEEGDPLSTRFGDVYYSRENGLAEARHVFLNGNSLPERLAALPPEGKPFTVGETGFGTGLNFLALWQLFARQAPVGAVLDYHSYELYPLTGEEIAKALARFPELVPLLPDYLPAWERLLQGSGTEHFTRKDAAGKPVQHIRLTVYFGDAVEGMATQVARKEMPVMDAWFLDGFNPACNPELWNDRLYASLAELSGKGTSFATFTAAGHVRRGLQAAGFQVNRQPGYGRKREMLAGWFEGKSSE